MTPLRASTAAASAMALLSPQVVILMEKESTSTLADRLDAFGLTIAPIRSTSANNRAFQGGRLDPVGGSGPAVNQSIQWHTVAVVTGILPPQTLIQSWIDKATSNSAAQPIAAFTTSEKAVPANVHAKRVAKLITNEKSVLADLIQAKRSAAEIDKDSVAVADAATRDALALIRGANLGGSPLVMFSDDGVLALQWQRGEHGVAMVFAGDGLASIAFRRPGQFYAENGIEIGIYDDLPTQFTDALVAVLT